MKMKSWLTALILGALSMTTATRADAQACTICIDGWSEISSFHPNRYFVAVVWGYACSPGSECVRCDSFWLADGSCPSSNGQHVYPEGPHDEENSLTLMEAIDYLDEYGCTPECNSEEIPALDALVELANAGNTEELARLISESEGLMVLNGERAAIQALGCDN